MPDAMFTLPNGRILLAPTSIINTMHQYRQLNPKSREQGGTLFGVMRAEENELVSIENPPCIELRGVTEPCGSDHATRTQFIRKCNHHLVVMQKASVIDKSLVYLGEWHTHPQAHPSPSNMDLSSWRKAFKNKVAVVAIIGQVSDWWGLWMGDDVCNLSPNLTP